MLDELRAGVSADKDRVDAARSEWDRAKDLLDSRLAAIKALESHLNALGYHFEEIEGPEQPTTRQRILDVISGRPLVEWPLDLLVDIFTDEGWSAHMGDPAGAIKAAANRLVREGKVQRLTPGMYSLAGASRWEDEQALLAFRDKQQRKRMARMASLATEFGRAAAIPTEAEGMQEGT